MWEEPLIKAYPPPSEPPIAQMVFDGPDGEIAVEGVLSVRHWDIPPNPQVVAPWDGPHKWPQPPTPRKAPARKLRFLTDARPGSVTVTSASNNLSPLVIDENPDWVDYTCVRSEIRRCMNVTQEGVVELDEIPLEVMRNSHFAVYADWASEEAEDEYVFAHWLFNFSDE